MCILETVVSEDFNKYVKSYHVSAIVDHVAAILGEARTPELEAKVMLTLHGLCKDWRGEERPYARVGC